ncbi:DNA internalization-related competence protein ComEC/Rec2 [uncultured Senegalimassilia sp.]|uniref:DNA internalization-related competence protein ComEC/Rec2 n=1 Tax=uncultured Senegalimassilia sp. TaxID=1714350 RepID=UPI0026763F8E|nr:DNA internalization-related competence protein ComEC/Rec2 [uncultured Senegalimassilia sp.]
MRRVAIAQSELLNDGFALEQQDFTSHVFPARPTIPVALALAVGLWAGSAATLTLTMQAEAIACIAAALANGIAASALLLLWWRKRKLALAWMLAIGLLAGGALGCAKAATLHVQQAEADNMSGRLSIVALADGSSGSFGTSCLARVTAESSPTSGVATVSFPKDTPTVAYGNVFEGYGTVSAPSQTREAYCWQKGAVANVKLRTCEQVGRADVLGMLTAIRQQAITLLTQPQRIDNGLAAALVCGWRGALDEETYRDFQVSGLAHVVAVSGAHLSIMVAFVASAVRLLKLPRNLSMALQISLVLAYLVLTAVPVSAVRAAVMTIAGLLSWTARRRASSLSSLSVCMAGLIALDPLAALSASFALSAFATLGIVLFGSLIDRWIERLAPRVPAFTREALALTLASSVLATPLSVALFSQLPLVAPLANMATGPLFGPVCTAGILCSMVALAFPAAAGCMAAVACGLAWLLRSVTHAVACIPYASIPVTLSLGAALALGFACAAALWLWWPTPSTKKRRRRNLRWACASVAGCLLVGALLVAFGQNGATEIIALDVGQGDAILVRSKGKAILIDTGNQDNMLREALARQRIAHLDAIVITHPDDDHMGSLTSLRGVVQTDRVLVANDALTCACASCCTLRNNACQLVGEHNIAGLSQGDAITAGFLTLTCVWPAAFTDEGGNADSVCLLADADVNGDGQGEWRILLVGDAEHDQLAAMIENGSVGDVDLYKVGHHGSKNALTEEQARTLQPEISLVSVGAHNRYGHPAANTLDALQAAGSTILRTDEHGDVVCRFTERAIEVSCLR